MNFKQAHILFTHPFKGVRSKGINEPDMNILVAQVAGKVRYCTHVPHDRVKSHSVILDCSIYLNLLQSTGV